MTTPFLKTGYNQIYFFKFMGFTFIKFVVRKVLELPADVEANSEPCQTFTMESFAKINNGFYLLIIFAECPHLR